MHESHYVVNLRLDDAKSKNLLFLLSDCPNCNRFESRKKLYIGDE